MHRAAQLPLGRSSLLAAPRGAGRAAFRTRGRRLIGTSAGGPSVCRQCGQRGGTIDGLCPDCAREETETTLESSQAPLEAIRARIDEDRWLAAMNEAHGPMQMQAVPEASVPERSRRIVAAVSEAIAAALKIGTPEVRWFTQGTTLRIYGAARTRSWGGPEIWIANLPRTTRDLVDTVAHEVRHIWQDARWRRLNEPDALRFGKRVADEFERAGSKR